MEGQNAVEGGATPQDFCATIPQIFSHSTIQKNLPPHIQNML